MHLPTEFRARDAWAIVEAFPFATLIALPSGEATHVPLVRRSQDTLVGHVARASALASEILGGTELRAIFTGPHAYVSPFDYDVEGRDAGQQVPTWNYVAAHASGHAHPITSPPAVRLVLQELAQRFDARGWTDAALPEAHREGLSQAIVAFELRVEKLVGKEKLGQNRTPAQRLAAGAALEKRPTEMEREVGRRMRVLGSSLPE